MKTIIAGLLCLIATTASSQHLPNSGFDKVRIVEPDRTIQAEIKPAGTPSHLKKDLFYAWYSANTIQLTQGGYSGKLLNGQYTEYYPNKNLREQGTYKNGLRNGIWKDWKEDGSLTDQSTWKNGIVLPDSTVSFWKKLPFIRKRKNPAEKVVPKS